MALEKKILAVGQQQILTGQPFRMGTKLLSRMDINSAKGAARALIEVSMMSSNGIADPILTDTKTGTNIIYVPESDPDHQQIIDSINTEIGQGRHPGLEVRLLKKSFLQDFEQMNEKQWLEFKHGMLYLPHRYVSSSSRDNQHGRFTGEMYYWDSYLYVLQLLASNQLCEAQDLVKNFFYQIDHYGMVLNANRTYYLGRSQPPLLSSMVMAIYHHMNKNVRDTHSFKNVVPPEQWLRQSMPYLEKEFEVWEQKSSREVKQGVRLAAYFDRFNHPCPEALDEPEYIEMAFGKPVEDTDLLTKYPNLFISIKDKTYFISSLTSELIAKYLDTTLTREFVNAGRENNDRARIAHDNAQRASGFDPCKTAFEEACACIIPVDLNTLLFKTALDISYIAHYLQEDGHAGKGSLWREKANTINRNMNELLWDKQNGMFRNYNLYKQNYTETPFITMVYPMTFGLASDKQAASTARYIINNLTTLYGIKNTVCPGNDQWDHIWAIMNYFANKGFRMYSRLPITINNEQYLLGQVARELSIRWINSVTDIFKTRHTFFEKTNAFDGSPDFPDAPHYGNQTGFTWQAGGFITIESRIDR
ncbi:MAG: trehalase family glycosidase [Candidatus Margulisiibacteriota bacterium]